MIGVGALREIFVKAVCARGRETCERTHRFRAKYHPEEILGARITNATCRASLQDEEVTVNGSYDVHVWYSYHTSDDDGHGTRKDTAVAVQTFDFSTPIPVESLTDDLNGVGHPEVRVRWVRTPRVKDCVIDADGVIHVTVQDGYGVQVVGETALWVPVYAGVGDDELMKKSDDDLWEALQDAEEDFDPDFIDSADDVELEDDLEEAGFETDTARNF